MGGNNRGRRAPNALVALVRRPALRSLAGGRRGAFTALTLASYPALLAAAVWPLPATFAVLVPLSYAAEAALPGRAAGALSRAHLGATVRFLSRETAAVVLLARLAPGRPWWFAALAAGLFLFHGLRAVQTLLAEHVDRRHNQMPVVTRNIDLPALRIPPAPPLALLTWRGARLLYLDALAVVPAAAGAASLSWTGLGRTHLGWLGAAGAVVALALEAAAVAALLVHARRARHLGDRRRVLDAVDDWVTAYRPEVVMYFSGSATSAYQATMWLGTLERITPRTLVVLRDRPLVTALGATTLPVVCIPLSVDLMNFRALDGVRVALFPANVGNNIHMLRVPGVRSVFIGHGDSDKEASFNPYTKVYDEVWVAGPAGRDRYLRAQVGVRDEAVEEVGRPQLAGVLRTSPYTEGAAPYRTVLYAPTWEGWSDDLFHSSLAAMGPAIVRALLDQPVRVIYKPHPLTGHRSPAARAAHRKVMALLQESTGLPHLAVTGREPSLYECFNEADVLISDISSVVSDFVASGKPYVVANVADLPPDRFRERYPAAGAAYLLGPDLAELPGILRSLGAPGEDEMAAARRALRAYLLGADHPDPLARFEEAVRRAAARAEARARSLGLEALAPSARD
ncbi:CDP-glycerol glycerophosphotransferase family protein [Microbispora sp. NEAU-D428]|uniref:CDP-glycerol glycerophosphotransferase family protein n=1 Tax=Microbispora sitophila TaxID=2771537 RepID=UPI001866B98B|nr:CDP-glycerol glycerophosphotransferase family protein [Microbispora sitophila]MBE3008914.1 CDP-glycerol glycerophosphotransferase family protein [Microbispora sitophila]